MKIAIYQGPAIGGDIEAGFARIETQLTAAAQAGATMAVFPEAFLPGYNRPDLHQGLAQPLGGTWMARLSQMTARLGCGLTIGWAEADGDKVYNAATTFDASGTRLAHYRKIQLFGDMERKSFQPGEAYTTFALNGIRTALLICYDIEFPHHCRRLAEQGVELVLVPTANPAGFEHVSDVLVPARASEMGLTIAYANYCGQEGSLAYGGHSVVVGPDARPLVSAGVGEALLIADLAPVSQIAPELLSLQRRDYREVRTTNET